MRPLTLLLSCCGLMLGTALAGEAPPTFTKKPAATKDGDKVKIAFAVSRETDVTVGIEDPAGKVVRHLVSGLLGRNPPAPLKAENVPGKNVPGTFTSRVPGTFFPGTFSVEWDGKDDEGKPAAGGPFKVRVGLGLAPKLEEYLLATGGHFGAAQYVGVDRSGNLYHGANAGGMYSWNAPGMILRVYDRQGKYLRTIQPFPPNLPLERLKGSGAFEADGRIYPVWHDIMKMRTYPGREITAGDLVVTSKGRMYKVVVGEGSAYCFRVLNADGSMPEDQPTLSPAISPNLLYHGNVDGPVIYLCAGSDEEFIYAAGFVGPGDKVPPLHAVYRAPADGKAPGAVFLGAAAEGGNDDKHLNGPKGLACDGKGFLYVCDSGNNRIQVFKEADGSLAGSIPVQHPVSVRVHPRTGAVYVLQAVGRNYALVKLSGREDPKEVARLSLAFEGGVLPLLLDSSAEPPVLYATARGVFSRIEDRGTSFEGKQPQSSRAQAALACTNAEDLLVDRERDELYIKPTREAFLRMDLKTGKTVKLAYPYFNGDSGTQLGVSPDGRVIYAWGYMGQGVRKFDRDFKPLNWEAGGKNKLEGIPSIMSFSSRGLCVAPNGDLYFINGTAGKPVQMDVYGPDGAWKRTAVWRCTEGATGPRLDRQGNIYLAECIKAPGKALPDWFDGKLPAGTRPRNPWSSPGGSAAWMYGSIVKFSPSGGAVWSMPGTNPGKSGNGGDIPAEILSLPKVKVGWITTNWGGLGAIDLQGALWYYYGTSPFTEKYGNYDCNCQSARFDVDDFGRTFFPDVGRFRVGVLDTNGNFLTDFGQYGNRDDVPCPVTGNQTDKTVFAEHKGKKIYLFNKECVPEFNKDPEKYVKKVEAWPKIGFAYPYTVACSRTHVFVGDLLNNRIAKLRLAYSVEESCAAQ